MLSPKTSQSLGAEGRVAPPGSSNPQEGGGQSGLQGGVDPDQTSVPTATAASGSLLPGLAGEAEIGLASPRTPWSHGGPGSPTSWQEWELHPEMRQVCGQGDTHHCPAGTRAQAPARGPRAPPALCPHPPAQPLSMPPTRRALVGRARPRVQ